MCPECAGRWLDGWRYQHAHRCGVRAALDATHAADLDRLRTRGPFTRAATEAERALAVAHGRDDLGPDAVPLAELEAEVEPHPFGRHVVLVHPSAAPFDPDYPNQEN